MPSYYNRNLRQAQVPVGLLGRTRRPRFAEMVRYHSGDLFQENNLIVVKVACDLVEHLSCSHDLASQDDRHTQIGTGDREGTFVGAAAKAGVQVRGGHDQRLAGVGHPPNGSLAQRHPQAGNLFAARTGSIREYWFALGAIQYKDRNGPGVEVFIYILEKSASEKKVRR